MSGMFEAMAGASPYHHIGSVDPAASERVENAIARLRGRARHPQRDLTTIAACWFTPASCFGAPGLAPPTREGVETVARFLAHPAEQVAVAAVGALRAALAVWSHPGGPIGAAPWGPAMPESVVHVVAALSSPHNLVRLAAARLAAAYPTPELEHCLRARLDDPLFSVRWWAVTALAPHSGSHVLFAVLRASLPHDRSGRADSHRAFWEAARAIGRVAECEALLGV